MMRKTLDEHEDMRERVAAVIALIPIRLIGVMMR